MNIRRIERRLSGYWLVFLALSAWLGIALMGLKGIDPRIDQPATDSNWPQYDGRPDQSK